MLPLLQKSSCQALQSLRRALSKARSLDHFQWRGGARSSSGHASPRRLPQCRYSWLNFWRVTLYGHMMSYDDTTRDQQAQFGCFGRMITYKQTWEGCVWKGMMPSASALYVRYRHTSCLPELMCVACTCGRALLTMPTYLPACKASEQHAFTCVRKLNARHTCAIDDWCAIEVRLRLHENASKGCCFRLKEHTDKNLMNLAAQFSTPIESEKLSWHAASRCPHTWSKCAPPRVRIPALHKYIWVIMCPSP